MKFREIKNNQITIICKIDEMKVIKSALFETLEELGSEGSFHARAGVDREVGVNLLGELNSFFDKKKIK